MDPISLVGRATQPSAVSLTSSLTHPTRREVTGPRRVRHLRLPRNSRLPCRAQADGEAATQTSSSRDSSPASPAAASAAAASAASASAAAGDALQKKSVIRRVTKGPPASDAAADADLQLKSLEDPGVSLEGVVRLDNGPGFSLGQLALLVAGDALSLVLFAYIGRATHVSSAVDLELLKTALPFLTGWLVSAVIWGEYLPSRPLPKGLSAVAGSTARTWATGVPLGIVIRSVFKGQPPQVPFMIVSMVTTAVIVTAWRYAYFNLAAKDVEASSDATNRSGTVFEFFELLTSLVRRW